MPFGLHVPVWIEDPDFDLDYHLRRAALPAPGGAAELAAFVADVAGRPLDRRHPLWEAYVVEGLEHGYQAFVTKVHHSLIDGAAGRRDPLGAVRPRTRTRRSSSPTVAPASGNPERVPSDLEMLEPLPRSRSRSARRRSCAPRDNLVPRRRARRAPGAANEALDVALPLTAPRLSMNRYDHAAPRVVAFSSVPLADVKAVKNALGVTVNDVVLGDH